MRVGGEYLDFAQLPSALHSAGDIYSVSPDVILRLSGPYDPSYYGSMVNTYGKIKQNEKCD